MQQQSFVRSAIIVVAGCLFSSLLARIELSTPTSHIVPHDEVFFNNHYRTMPYRSTLDFTTVWWNAYNRLIQNGVETNDLIVTASTNAVIGYMATSLDQQFAGNMLTVDYFGAVDTVITNLAEKKAFDGELITSMSDSIVALKDTLFIDIGGATLFDPSWTWTMAAQALQEVGYGSPSDYLSDGLDNDFKMTASLNAVIALKCSEDGTWFNGSFEPLVLNNVDSIALLLASLARKTLNNANSGGVAQDLMYANSNAIVALQKCALADSNAMLAASSAIVALQDFVVANPNSGENSNYILANSYAMAWSLNSRGSYQQQDRALFDPSWTWSWSVNTLLKNGIGNPFDYAPEAGDNDYKITASCNALAAYSAVCGAEPVVNADSVNVIQQTLHHLVLQKKHIKKI